MIQRNIPIFQYFPLPISILSQNQHFPLVHYFPLHQKCSYISVFSAFSILSTISIFICITIVSAILMFFHQFSFYLSKVGIKRKRFFFLDKCTGILDESQEQEPQKQPQEASEAAEDLSVYEEMYKRGDWSCFMCSKWFGRKDVLRQHLVLHYKKQLGKQFVSKENNPEKNICGLCQFQAKDPKALIQHIALGTHLKKRKKKIELSYIFKFFYVFRNFSLATFISNFLCFSRFRDSAIFTFLF